ncbi:MAG: protein-glutamate O-methyltransferase CheR [Pseudomonadota bacterium]
MHGNLAEHTGDVNGIVPGVSPQVYSQADFIRIAALVRRDAGIVLGDRKQMLAYTRLAPLVRESGLGNFKNYLDTLENDRAEATRVISALTTNHTYFNREPHHFEHFTTNLRNNLIAKAQGSDPVRIWSAGCSSGEEIWTLLMVLLGEDKNAGARIAKSKVVALASDLSADIVEAAKEAIYPKEGLDAVPAALQKNWCNSVEKDGKPSFSIGPELRKMVRFRQLNLLGPWPFTNHFDVIFCRNVMIYFDGPSKERLVLRLAQQLHPGGFLYIGHSERVVGDAAALLNPVGPTIYQRNSR